MKYAIVFFSMFLLFSCNSDSKLEQEIEAIPMDVKIVRFDKEFARATPETLNSLKQKYPVFFPEQFHDSIWLGNLNDPIQQQLNEAVENAFPTEETIEDQLLPLFQHISYYFPEFEAPTTVTVTSDVAEAYARQLISPPSKRDLLSQMVYYGKELYLKDIWLPNVSDAEKIGYTKEEMQWANDNEEDMWRYFIEKELLYKTDPKLAPRFIFNAPFSKFYLEIDNESPGMVGRYIGWQIVRSYMENNTVTVPQLLIKNADEIFKNSKYKPKKN